MRNSIYAWALFSVACSAQTADPRIFSDPVGAGGGGTAGSSIILGSGGASGTGLPPVTMPMDDGGPKPDGGPVIVTSLPDGFTATEIGGFQLGAALSGGADAGAAPSSSGSENCGNILLGVLRDFKGKDEPGGHPDFEGPMYGNDITTHLVGDTLDTSQKPMYASVCEMGSMIPQAMCPFGAETTSKANFEQWYNYTAEVNKPYLVHLYFAPENGGLFRFQSLSFFPLDGAGWGNSPPGVHDRNGKNHNFSFTTEVHTQFKYNGGETFTFEGDDDIWIFINGHLAVDLGGLHPKAMSSVVLDTAAATLGIVKGNTYRLDLFHAERHSYDSTFSIETNLSFVSCGVVIPDIVN